MTDLPAHREPISIRAGTELLRQSQPVQSVDLIEDGIVKLVREEVSGGQTIVGLRGVGWFLGALSVLCERPSPVSGVAMTPCVVRRQTSARFRRQLEQDRSLASHLQELHCAAAVNTMIRLSRMGSCDARTRVLHVIHLLVVAHGHAMSYGGVRIAAPLQQCELAQLVGVTPEHLSRLLKRFHDDRLLDTSKGWLIVPDPNRLQAEIAEEDAGYLSGKAYV